MNHKNDKRVGLKWMELRVHDNVEGLKTPTGRIPKYGDLQRLFQDTLGKEYSHGDYIKQFTVRIPENLAKIERIMKIYQQRVLDSPEIVFTKLEEQRQKLNQAREEFGDYISPDRL